MPCIYKITSPTGKIYIGQSWDINKRLYSYKKVYCTGQPKLYNSIKKYGWDNHMIKIVSILPNDIDQSVLDQYESVYHELYISCNVKTMNVREPGKGGRLSVDSKIKIGLANKGKQPMLGKKHTEETKLKMSIAQSLNSGMRGKTLTEEHKKCISEWSKKPRPNRQGKPTWNKGLKNTISDETRLKMSQAKKGKIPWNKTMNKENM